MTECRALGGDGVVGVKLRVDEFTLHTVEFTALGTAVRARSRVRPREPFTSHVGGQDFARLVRSGWIPTSLVFGIALETRHDDWRTSGRTRWTAGNQEIDGYTQLVGHVRRKAHEHLADGAARHGADGVVVDDIALRMRENECPSFGNERDLVAEAALVGTAVARFGRSERPAEHRPLTIMRLEREHWDDRGNGADSGRAGRGTGTGDIGGGDAAAGTAPAGGKGLALHLGPVGERVPAGARGRLPPPSAWSWAPPSTTSACRSAGGRRTKVVRRRSVADRLAGREGAVTALDVVLGEQRLSLRTDRGRVTGEICHEVRGIVLSRRQVGLDEWIEALARSLADAAASSARAREAVERYLTRPAGAPWWVG